MWDVGGQETLRSSWSAYYANARFVIMVIDSTDRERLPLAKTELYSMLAHEACRCAATAGARTRRWLTRSRCLRQDLKRAALLVLANKQDVRGAMTAAEISETLSLTSIKEHGWHIQGCCALTGEGYAGVAER